MQTYHPCHRKEVRHIIYKRRIMFFYQESPIPMKEIFTIIEEIEQIIDDLILEKQERILTLLSNSYQKIIKKLNKTLIFTRYIKNNIFSTVRIRLLKI